MRPRLATDLPFSLPPTLAGTRLLNVTNSVTNERCWQTSENSVDPTFAEFITPPLNALGARQSRSQKDAIYVILSPFDPGGVAAGRGPAHAEHHLSQRVRSQTLAGKGMGLAPSFAPRVLTKQRRSRITAQHVHLPSRYACARGYPALDLPAWRVVVDARPHAGHSTTLHTHPEFRTRIRAQRWLLGATALPYVGRRGPEKLALSLSPGSAPPRGGEGHSQDDASRHDHE